MKRLSSRVTWAAVVAVALLLVGAAAACRRPAAASAAPPPPEVSVLTVAPETVTARYEYVGQAAADQTKKDYEDTFVRAEISGRAGRSQLELGARVTGPGDLLTTVERVDPIDVNFSPSDQDVLRWRRDIATRRLLVPARVLAVQVTLEDGSIFPGTGQLNFVDLALQRMTGTLSLRAEFRNPQHVLLPGQFVRLHFVGLKRPDAILVPQRAVQRGLAGALSPVLGACSWLPVGAVGAPSWKRGGW